MSSLAQMVKALSEASGIILNLKVEIKELRAMAVRAAEAGEAAIKQRDDYKESFALYVEKEEELTKAGAAADRLLANRTNRMQKCPMGHHCSTHCPSAFRLT